MKRPGGFDAASERAAPRGESKAPKVSKTLKTPRSEPAPQAAPDTPQIPPAPLLPAENESTLPVEPSHMPADSMRGSDPTRAPRGPRGADPVKAAEKRVREAEKRNRRSARRETRRFTALARRSRRRILIAVGSVVALVLFVLLGAFTPLMSVREVRVEGAATVNVDEITAALAEFDGVPLALVNENDVLEALAGFPLIQRFAVERVPPHTLVVRIQERTPVMALETEGATRLYDAAGVLIAEGVDRPAGVPLGGDGVSDASSEAFRAAATIVRDMPADLRGQLATVNATTGQDVTFTLTSGIEVFWGNADETKRKSLVLQTLLASLAGQSVSHIDVSSVEAPIFRS